MRYKASTERHSILYNIFKKMQEKNNQFTMFYTYTIM